MFISFQIEQLQSKHDDLFDKYRRSLAESDNMRKRLTKQIEEGKQFGIQVLNTNCSFHLYFFKK